MMKNLRDSRRNRRDGSVIFAAGRWVRAALLAAALIPALSAGPAAAEPGTRTLYLIRHGEYDHEDPLPHDVGKKLTPLGMAQARIVAARLRGLPDRIDAITTSSLTRARETGRIVIQDFPGLTLLEDSLLSECTPPTWREDIMAREDSTDLRECREQLDAAFAKYTTPSADGDRTDVLICHGNVTRYFVTKALGVDTMAWLNMSVAHCSITRIVVRPDGSTKVLGVGDIGHVPPNLQSGTDSQDHNLRVPEAAP